MSVMTALPAVFHRVNDPITCMCPHCNMLELCGRCNYNRDALRVRH